MVMVGLLATGGFSFSGPAMGSWSLGTLKSLIIPTVLALCSFPVPRLPPPSF